MNRAPDLLAAVRAEINAAPHDELPSIIGGLAALHAEALARYLSAPMAQTMTMDDMARIESALADIRAAVEKDELLTEREVASLRHKTVDALRKERGRRMGPPWVKDGAKVLYSKRALAEWLAEQRHETRDTQAHPRFGRHGA